MKILVIDGQGGGLGRALIQRLCEAFPGQTIYALGTNALATSAMLKAGAHAGATGVNAIICQCRDAGLILGPTGLLLADAMLGEISPAIKILIPSDRCSLRVAGLKSLSLDDAINDAVSKAEALISGEAI
mgnify:CR=1 FL=1